MQGPENDELSTASWLENDVIFYQTVELNVSKLFGIYAEAKQPALVLDVEKLNHFGELFIFFS